MLGQIREKLEGKVGREPVAAVEIDGELESSKSPVNDVYIASCLARAEIIEREDDRPLKIGRGPERIAESMYRVNGSSIEVYEKRAIEVAENVRELYRQNPSMSVQSFVNRTVEELGR